MHDDLPHAMRETARRLDPDVGRLTAGGVTRGTRRRHLERFGQVLGSVIAVAAVFAGVVLGVAHRGVGERAGSGPAGVRPTSTPGALFATGTVPPTTTTPPTTTPPTTAPQISANQLIDTLKHRLAGTGVTGFAANAWGTGAVGALIRVDAQLSAQHGVGNLDIVFGDQRDPIPESATPHALEDRSVAYTSQQSGSADGRNPSYLSVALVRPDGSRLTATEADSASGKGPAVPGAPMLLSVQQIITLLDSSDWDAAVAAASTSTSTSTSTNANTPQPPQ